MRKSLATIIGAAAIATTTGCDTIERANPFDFEGRTTVYNRAKVKIEMNKNADHVRITQWSGKGPWPIGSFEVYDLAGKPIVPGRCYNPRDVASSLSLVEYHKDVFGVSLDSADSHEGTFYQGGFADKQRVARNIFANNAQDIETELRRQYPWIVCNDTKQATTPSNSSKQIATIPSSPIAPSQINQAIAVSNSHYEALKGRVMTNGVASKLCSEEIWELEVPSCEPNTDCLAVLSGNGAAIGKFSGPSMNLRMYLIEKNNGVPNLAETIHIGPETFTDEAKLAGIAIKTALMKRSCDPKAAINLMSEYSRAPTPQDALDANYLMDQMIK